MSKININDVDFYFEDEDRIKDINNEDRARRKQRTRIRRKIEYLVEQQKLKEISHSENYYQGD